MQNSAMQITISQVNYLPIPLLAYIHHSLKILPICLNITQRILCTLLIFCHLLFNKEPNWVFVSLLGPKHLTEIKFPLEYYWSTILFGGNNTVPTYIYFYSQLVSFYETKSFVFIYLFPSGAQTFNSWQRVLHQGFNSPSGVRKSR